MIKTMLIIYNAFAFLMLSLMGVVTNDPFFWLVSAGSLVSAIYLLKQVTDG